MKRIFVTTVLCISLFVFGANSAFAFGGWNSGGVQTMNVGHYGYGYAAPMYGSAYVPVQNFGMGGMYGGYNTYMPSYYGNTWNQGFGGGFGMGMGINSGMGMGWGGGGFMPVGYGGGFGMGGMGMGGWNSWGGGCSMYCYGSPIFY